MGIHRIKIITSTTRRMKERRIHTAKYLQILAKSLSNTSTKMTSLGSLALEQKTDLLSAMKTTMNSVGL
jgi:hypothetical protein